MKSLPFLSLALVLTAPARADVQVCHGLSLKQEVRPALTGNEKKLVCGDPTDNNGKSEGWKTIPFDQVEFNLRNAFQSRGYLSPRFTRGPAGLIADPGPLVRVRTVVADGGPPELDVRKKRRVLGEPLTPKLLDLLQDWTRHQLEHEGYACAQVKARALAGNGEVVLNIDRGPLVSVGAIRVLGTPDLDPEVLRRYDAFAPGSRYDGELMAISADRTMTDGAVERTYFSALCPTTGPEVRQTVIPGGPRVIGLGISVNTEEIGVLKLSWQRTRIGHSASSFTAETRDSAKRQDLDAFFDWRFAKPSSPAFARPLVGGFHENENPFEVTAERAQVSLGSQVDFAGMGLSGLIGPRYELFQKQRGVGPSTAHALELDAAVQLVSHEYEFNRTQLGNGFRLLLDSQANDTALASSFGAVRGRVRAEKIWNVGNYDPPAVIVALRGLYGITAVQDGPTNAALVPPHLLQYLGGIENLRGFGRMELPTTNDPNGITGAVSAGYVGLDIKPDLLPEALVSSLRPSAFIDFAMLGRASYSPTEPYFWSPGAGLDWKSPIGTVQATLAHGFVSGNGSSPYRGHWQFYLSLGMRL